MDLIPCENATITNAAAKNQEEAYPKGSEKAQEEFPCITCESIFLKVEECREHMTEHEMNRTLKCRYCDENLPSMEKLLHHLKKHMNEFPLCDGKSVQEGRGRKKGSYVYKRTCDGCGEVLTSKANLNYHKKLHNVGKFLFSCPYCSYRSDFPNAIGKHLKKKHENLEMLYKCALCKFVAIKISLLKSHVSSNQHLET